MSDKPSILTIPLRLASNGAQWRHALRQFSGDLRVAAPAFIKSFDPVKQTVSVQLAIRERVVRKGKRGNEDVDYIHDIPIVMPRGGGFALTMPILPGDECLLVFGDRCMDDWWQSGNVGNQLTGRQHDLSDAYAVLGTWSQPHKLPLYAPTTTQLRNFSGSTYVEVTQVNINLVTGAVGKSLGSNIVIDPFNINAIAPTSIVHNAAGSLMSLKTGAASMASAAGSSVLNLTAGVASMVSAAGNSVLNLTAGVANLSSSLGSQLNLSSGLAAITAPLTSVSGGLQMPSLTGAASLATDATGKLVPGIAATGGSQVQCDWNATTGLAHILNQPPITYSAGVMTFGAAPQSFYTVGQLPGGQTNIVLNSQGNPYSDIFSGAGNLILGGLTTYDGTNWTARSTGAALLTLNATGVSFASSVSLTAGTTFTPATVYNVISLTSGASVHTYYVSNASMNGMVLSASGYSIGAGASQETGAWVAHNANPFAMNLTVNGGLTLWASPNTTVGSAPTWVQTFLIDYTGNLIAWGSLSTRAVLNATSLATDSTGKIIAGTGGGGVIASINTDTTPAQRIVGSGTITVSTASGVTTIGGGGSPLVFAGDLSGSGTTQTVIGLRNKALDATTVGTPTDGWVITYDGASGTYKAKAPATPPPTFTAGGDLSGSATSQTVIGLRGKLLDATTVGTPTDGWLIQYDGASGTYKAKAPGAVGVAGSLSNISPAVAVNTIANASFTQTWNWALTGASNGMVIGETAAGAATGALVQINALSSAVTALDVESQTATSQIHFGTTPTTGGWLTSATPAAPSIAQFSAGANDVAQAWTARATSASILTLNAVLGGFTFYGDTGKTVGQTYTPTQIASIDSSGNFVANGSLTTKAVLSAASLATDSTGKIIGGAGQVNSDWNAVSGVAQILNKPTIPASPPVSTNFLATNASGQFIATPSSAALTVANLYPASIATCNTFSMSGANPDFRLYSPDNSNFLELYVNSASGPVFIGTHVGTAGFRFNQSAGNYLAINTPASGNCTIASSTGTVIVTSYLDGIGYCCRAGTGGVYGSTNYQNLFYTSPSMALWVNTTNMGNITVSSDYRIKEEVELLGEALPLVMRLRPITFKYKATPNSIFDGTDGLRHIGFLAHEVGEVWAAACVGKKDELTVDGLIQPQSINIHNLVALLTKAVQELSAKVDQIMPEMN